MGRFISHSLCAFTVLMVRHVCLPHQSLLSGLAQAACDELLSKVCTLPGKANNGVRGVLENRSEYKKNVKIMHLAWILELQTKHGPFGHGTHRAHGPRAHVLAGRMIFTFFLQFENPCQLHYFTFVFVFRSVFQNPPNSVVCPSWH